MVGLADLDLEGLLPFLTEFYVLDEEGDCDNITDDIFKEHLQDTTGVPQRRLWPFSIFDRATGLAGKTIIIILTCETFKHNFSPIVKSENTAKIGIAI